MITKPRLMNAQALLELPYGHLRHELIGEEPKGMVPTGPEHGWLEGEDVVPGWALPLAELFESLSL